MKKEEVKPAVAASPAPVVEVKEAAVWRVI
jgi:hypothetical protein